MWLSSRTPTGCSRGSGGVRRILSLHLRIKSKKAVRYLSATTAGSATTEGRILHYNRLETNLGSNSPIQKTSLHLHLPCRLFSFGWCEQSITHALNRRYLRLFSGSKYHRHPRVDMSERQILVLIPTKYISWPCTSSHVYSQYSRVLVHPALLEDSDEADGKFCVVPWANINKSDTITVRRY